MSQFRDKSLRRIATSAALVLGIALAGDQARASEESDALATARRCASEVARVGNIAYVDCMDQTALTDFKRLLVSVLERNADGRDALIRRTFGETASFDDIAALEPTDFMKRLLQQRESAAQKAKIGTTSEVVGAVKEGERVHVIVRERSGPLQPSGAQVVVTDVQSYVKRAGQWRMELRGDVKQMEQMFRKQLDAQ